MTHGKSVVVPVSAIVGFDVEEYVGGYEFRGDEGGYMPTDKERELITDAIHGVMSELSCLSAPAPSSLAGGEVWAALEPFAKVADTALCPSDEPDDNDFIRLDETIAITVADIRRAASVFAALSPEAPAREGAALSDALDLWIVDGLKKADRRIMEIKPSGCDGMSSEDVESGRVSAYQLGFQNGVRSTLTDASFVIMNAAAEPSDGTREAIKEACDLLAERTYGNPARSPGHNARLVLEAALTPRHEAPASPAWRDEYNRVEAIREAAEGQDRIARSTADPIAKSDAETQAAGHWTRYEREVAKLNAARRHEAPASDSEAMQRSMQQILDHDEAPAEGAGERECLAVAIDPSLAGTDFSGLFAEGSRIGKALAAADRILALRARSSAPEAREGAVAWKFRNMDLRQVGITMDKREADRKAEAGWEIEPLGPITHPAAPSADKLRKEVTRDQIMGVVRQYAAPAWCSVDRMADALLAIMSPASTPDALKGDAK